MFSHRAYEGNVHRNMTYQRLNETLDEGNELYYMIYFITFANSKHTCGMMWDAPPHQQWQIVASECFFGFSRFLSIWVCTQLVVKFVPTQSCENKHAS